MTDEEEDTCHMSAAAWSCSLGVHTCEKEGTCQMRRRIHVI